MKRQPKTLSNWTRAVRYARVSSDKQEPGHSLNDQDRLVAHYCQGRGIEVVARFEDTYSARTRDAVGESFKRPGFTAMLRYIEANRGQVDVIVFKNWTRWSRDAADALVMIRHVRERLGVELCAIEQPIDFDVPEQRPMLGLYVSMPEADNMRRSINIRRGLRQAKREGRWVHQAPTGYRKRYDDRGKVYIEPDPESADLVQDAFRLAATGTMTMDAIRKQVGKNARARGIKWYTSRYWFGEMLRNRAYLGEVFLKAWKDEPAEWMDGQHEALIDQATFAAVQREVERPSEGTKSKYVDELPLRGHLLHPETGERLTGSASKGRTKRYWYYHTQPNRQADHDTAAYRVRAEEANAAFAEHLAGVSLAPEGGAGFRESDGRSHWRAQPIGKTHDGLAYQAERRDRDQTVPG